jgi:hypothetical protein
MSSVPEEILQRALALAEEAVRRFNSNHAEIAVTHSLLRGALAMLGAEVHSSVNAPDRLVNSDDQDIESISRNCDVLIHKAKVAIGEDDVQTAIGYIRSTLGLLGCHCSTARPGSLTPRPRDYNAAVSRFGDDALSSPAHARQPSVMELAEHHHGK